jgi:hypothetical protein
MKLLKMDVVGRETPTVEAVCKKLEVSMPANQL